MSGRVVSESGLSEAGKFGFFGLIADEYDIRKRMRQQYISPGRYFFNLINPNLHLNVIPAAIPSTAQSATTAAKIAQQVRHAKLYAAA